MLEIARDLEHGLEMLPAGRLVFLLGHEHRGADCIADLSAVKRFPAPFIADQGLQCGALLGRNDGLAAEVVEEDFPDVGAPGAVQGGQAEGNMHAGLEGLVEGADAVRC